MSIAWTKQSGQSTHFSLLFRFLYIAFFLSGFSALTYQTAWQRMLGSFAGSDAVATTLVVGAFLFGLGIGSLMGGSFADRLGVRGAIRAFGLCELGVCACALLSPFVLYNVLYGRMAGLAASPLAILLSTFLVLLPPTVLMGMSLPLLSRAIVDRIETASTRIGWLYGVNTLGAGLGALLTGWIVIGSVGYEITVYGTAFDQSRNRGCITAGVDPDGCRRGTRNKPD